MRKILVAALAVVLGVNAPLAGAIAQPAFPAGKRVPAPAEPDAIPLYPASKAKSAEAWTEMGQGELWARNVTRPTLTPYLPAPGKATGAAVLVVPGGGFKFVSLANEGWPIARWLADQGVAAFVLKYRVDPTPEDEAAFAAEMAKMFSAPPSDFASPQMLATVDRAREDAQVALRLIRANAGKYGVDPARVGMLGFSAGAMTTMATTLADAPDARPDFIAPIYGFMTAVTPPRNPQPMFAALASDDPLFGGQGYGLAESWKKAGGSVELHVYAGGGHGFGSHRLGTPSDQWFNQFMAWMRFKGFLQGK